MSLCICQTSSPFISSLGGLKFRGLLAPASRGSCFDVSFLKFCSKKIMDPFWLSSGFNGCCEVYLPIKKKHIETLPLLGTVAPEPGACKFEILEYRVIVRKSYKLQVFSF